MSKYNGWSNWETWVVNLHFSEDIIELAMSSDFTFDCLHEASIFIKEYVEGYMHENSDIDNLYFQDIFVGFRGEVNWTELAGTMLEDMIK